MAGIEFLSPEEDGLGTFTHCFWSTGSTNRCEALQLQTRVSADQPNPYAASLLTDSPDFWWTLVPRLRIDGRRAHELRKIECNIGPLTQADGSAYLEQGNTRVLATVYGPHDVSRKGRALHDKAVINCQFSMATFSTGQRKKRPRGDKRSTEATSLMKQTFESAILVQLFPRSQIDIYVQVLQSDGGDLSVCINAASLAVIDAGIPMKDYVCACTASYIEDSPFVDINYIEETARGPALTLAVLPKSGKITLLLMESTVHEDNLKKVVDIGVKGCGMVYTVLNSFVREHLEESQ